MNVRQKMSTPFKNVNKVLFRQSCVFQLMAFGNHLKRCFETLSLGLDFQCFHSSLPICHIKQKSQVACL